MADILQTSYLNFADLWEYNGENFFDTPDFASVPVSAEDLRVVVDRTYLGRLDLIAYDYYGDSELWWVIALANEIEELPSGMHIGMNLRVPIVKTVSEYLSQRKQK